MNEVPTIVGHIEVITASDPMPLYAWSDGVVTWTKERSDPAMRPPVEFPPLTTPDALDGSVGRR